MSNSLYAKPVTDGKILSNELKDCIEKRMIEYNLVRVFNESDMEYLKGLFDAKVKDASVLLAMIQKYGSVEVTIK